MTGTDQNDEDSMHYRKYEIGCEISVRQNLWRSFRVLELRSMLFDEVRQSRDTSVALAWQQSYRLFRGCHEQILRSVTVIGTKTVIGRPRQRLER